ncbi:MAG: cysteine--tRNA ligase, partial [Gammaproteobacteria bacterium]
YFILTSHYRSPLNYSDDQLDQAKSALTRYYTALRDVELQADVNWQDDDDFGSRFRDAMDDDFNTALALSVMSDVRQALNKAHEQDNAEQISYLAALLHSFGDVLGLFQQAAESFLLGDNGDDDEVAKIEALIEQRNAARGSKDWAMADHVRDQLTEMGIVLEDNSGQTTWRRM